MGYRHINIFCQNRLARRLVKLMNSELITNPPFLWFEKIKNTLAMFHCFISFFIRLTFENNLCYAVGCLGIKDSRHIHAGSIKELQQPGLRLLVVLPQPIKNESSNFPPPASRCFPLFHPLQLIKAERDRRQKWGVC